MNFKESNKKYYNKEKIAYLCTKEWSTRCDLSYVGEDERTYCSSSGSCRNKKIMAKEECSRSVIG